jgi:hypothetical protein
MPLRAWMSPTVNPVSAGLHQRLQHLQARLRTHGRESLRGLLEGDIV